ncbi:MAG: hypothetical protein K6T63_13660 [Alicyclobacillus herbarius]|uniref:class I fructose-bisphosphate aldolase n=1 Tax=Alicyclobacillus herbarius TaxID=122960 RepID=UPI002355F22D|nr:hypothetical protein [Alicyclobacillus herbarius]MCL6633664.1 hypothetical protein [Alicyclobacillus herbarius]
MTGKEYRMGRLFNPRDKRTVILPVDHGIAMGHLEGLRDPVSTLRHLVGVGADAVLLNPGLSHAASDVFDHRGAPARILTVDNFFYDSHSFIQDRVGWAQKAVIDGYDGIKLLLPWDGTIRERMAATKLVAEFVKESDEWQIPVIVEPTLLRTHQRSDDQLSDAVRIAFELGADILKTPCPSSLDVLHEWVQSFKVPIVLLGGPKGSADSELLRSVSEAIRIGAKGIAIGRNVWQRPLAEAVEFFSQLVQIVHAEESRAACASVK